MYPHLDNTELLTLALDGMNTGRDAEATELLKTLLERDPGNVHAQYLLAAQHAQLGLMDRAEPALRAVVAQAPDFAVARFQLGQMLVLRGATAEAGEVLAPLASREDALAAFARAFRALAGEDVATGLHELEAGLALPQDNPALAHDMQQLLQRLQDAAASGPDVPSPAASSMLLAGYQRDV